MAEFDPLPLPLPLDGGTAFMQDLFAWPQAGLGQPGARRRDDLQILCVRHFTDAATLAEARAAFAAAGLPWPVQTNELCVQGSTLLMRRQPEEILLVGERGALDPLSAALVPGRVEGALALDLSQGMVALELQGPQAAQWLSHLVDASAIPAVGHAGRCRFIDVPVLLLRPEADAMLLLADRSLSPYLAQWLGQAHEGAFGAARESSL